jgi:hypothetical protein
MFQPSEAYRQRVAQIESGNNPKAKNPNSTAKGKYQFIDRTAVAYGLKDPFDEKQADDAFNRFTADNYKVLKNALRRDPTEGELYLAHQQGAGGALKLLLSPEKKASEVVGRDAVRLNGGDENMTAQQFAQKWTSKFNDETNSGLSQGEMYADAIAEGMRKARETGPRPIQQTAQMETMNDATEFKIARVKTPDGRIAKVRVPGGATDDEVLAFVQQQFQTSSEPPKEEGFLSRAGQAYDKRSANMRQSSEQYISGNQSLPEGVLQVAGETAGLANDVVGEAFQSVGSGLSSITPDVIETPVRQAGKRVFDTVANSPLGDLANTAVQKYGEFEKNNPRAARNINAATNLGLLGLSVTPVKGTSAAGATMDAAAQGAKAVGKGTQAVAEAAGKQVVKTAKNLNTKTVVPTSDEVRELGSKAFAVAEQKGGAINEAVANKFYNEIKAKRPQTLHGQVFAGENGVTKLIERIDVLKDKPMTLRAAQEIDEALGNLAWSTMDDFGKLNDEGRQFLDMQRTLRDIIDEADESMVIGGKEGFESLKEGRKYWAASMKLREIERIIEKAKSKEQPVTALKNGFSNLLNRGDKMKGYSKAERAAIEKASKTGVATDLVKLMGSGLVPIGLGVGAGSTMGPVAGVASYLAGAAVQQGAKKTGVAMQSKRASNVLEEIAKSRGLTKEVPRNNPLLNLITQ